MRNMFVPPYDHAGADAPLLMLQVTFFRCGGVALGTAMHHFVIDGRSAFHFIQTWASIARGGSTTSVAPPSLDRTPLRARSPPTVLFDHSREYRLSTPAPAVAVPKSSSSSEYASAILRVTGAQATALRARSGGASTFRALVSHVWRCACSARALPHDAESRLYTMVDMRARLVPPLPDAYFGNAVVRTSASARVGDLLSAADGLGFGARRLRAATAHGDGYARSVVDHLETADLAARGGGLPGTDLRVISWMGMPSHDADFGWGEPVVLAPALMYYAGFVYLLSFPGKAGDVAVAVALEPECMARFKQLFFEEMAAAME
uniref:Uncharacterized protein n=1 Tax=Avena sativa TaxID=4498 RepID=A0ACD5YFM6_AVESA